MIFSSKLLLFGEHTILRGSAALALPLPLFYGQWALASDANHWADLQRDLPKWCQYLHQLQGRGELETTLDTEAFAQDLANGLYFQSNIPNGYGAGSSGALCAAVYARYALEPLDREQADHYPQLKRILGQMEGFFHGSSSGTDPLIIYLNRAILLGHDGTITAVPVPEWPDASAGFQFFLLDTGISRSTGHWVNLFLANCADPIYLNMVHTQLAPRVDEAIRQFQEARWADLFATWSEISELQQIHFAPMIPDAFKARWAAGWQTGQYALKLCGAGGGGFILGMGKIGSLPPEALIFNPSLSPS